MHQLLLCFCFCYSVLALRIHSQQSIDLAQYVNGRTMVVNKCFHVLDDTTTKFIFKDNKMRIQSCNTQQCDFQIHDNQFSVGSCSKLTDNDCPNDPSEDYVSRFERTKAFLLQSNFITFKNEDSVTIQLADEK